MEIRRKGLLHILTPPGDQRGDLAEELIQEIQSLLEKHIRYVAFDLKNVRYTTSRAINTLVKCVKTLKAVGGELYFFNVRDDLHRVFQQTGLSFVCPVFSSEKELEEEAADQISGAPKAGGPDAETATPFHFEVTRQPPWAVVTLEGSLDKGEDQERLENCLQQLRAEGQKQIIINLQNLMFMDSSGVGRLKMFKQLVVDQDGGRFLLASPNEVVRDLFDLLGIFREMEVYETLEDALQK
jgi:stage II sporulation protein AA (anti-sigma F factor antagonist)